MWFKDVFIFASPELGIAIGQNNPYSSEEFAESVAIIFKGGKARLQLVDAEDGQAQFFNIPDEIVYDSLASLLTLIARWHIITKG